MKTYEMIALANQSGKTYISTDMRYNKQLGFHKKNGSVWSHKAFEHRDDGLDVFMKLDWQEDNEEQAMSKKSKLRILAKPLVDFIKKETILMLCF